MVKSLLVTCGSSPHVIEFMLPTLVEAKRQGWVIHGAYSDGAVKTMMIASRLFSGLHHFTGWWGEGYKDLSVPLADAIFKWARPAAVLIDYSGCGLAGGCWIEECYNRRITAVELHGVDNHVWYYGKKSREATAHYIEVLKSVGYGRIPHRCMRGTPAEQFVGFNIGDQLIREFTPGTTRRLLGLASDQKIVTVAGTWNKDFYGQMCSEDLVEWNAMAKEHSMRLVFSIHPAMRTSQGLPKVTFPPDVILTSNAPCTLWGYPTKLVPTVDVVRASEFVIMQFSSALRTMAYICHIPVWLRRAGCARGNSTSRIPRETEICEMNDEVRHKPGALVIWEYSKLLFASWRTQEYLDQLFAGTLGCKGTQEEWEEWEARWKLDGHTAERIVQLLTYG